MDWIEALRTGFIVAAVFLIFGAMAAAPWFLKKAREYERKHIS